MRLCFIGILTFILACSSKAEQVEEKSLQAITATEARIIPAGKTIAERFPAPAGFTRVIPSQNSFGAYLQHFKLKPDGALVHYYNGAVKPNDNIYDAVLDIDVGQYDLQQCADAVMRLRAEYLFKEKRYEDIHFNFTSGFRADYSKWQQGYRIHVKGNACSWVKKRLLLQAMPLSKII
ncbi:hypothetical protein GCM10028895_45050 [Pontibacter rugosus]